MTADPRYHPAAYVLDESKMEPYSGQPPPEELQTCKYTDSVNKKRMMSPPYGPYGTLPPGYHHAHNPAHHPGGTHIYESPQQGHRDSV